MRWKGFTIVVLSFLITSIFMPPSASAEDFNLISSAEFSQDGNMIAVGIDNGTVYVYKYNSTLEEYEIDTWLDVWEGASCSPSISWNSNGLLATSAVALTREDGNRTIETEGRLKIWDLTNHILVSEIIRYGSGWGSLKWSPNGDYLSYLTMNRTESTNGTRQPFYTYLHIYNYDTQEDIQFEISRELFGQNITNCCWSSDSQHIAYTNGYYHALDEKADNSGLRVINTQNGNISEPFELDWVGPVAWNPTKDIIAVRNNDTILMLDPHNLNITSSIFTDDWIWDMDWSPNGEKLCITTYDDNIAVIDYSTNETLWEKNTDGIYLDWSPSGDKILSITSYSSEMTIWDAETGKKLQSIEIPGLHGSLPPIGAVPMLIAICVSSVFFNFVVRRKKKLY